MKLSKPTASLQWSYTPSSVVADAVMRATGILLLMGIAVIHLVQLVPTFQSTPLLGMAFVALTASSVAAGARLVNPNVSGARLWLPVSVLGSAAVAGYVLTRVVSTFLDNQDVGNWSCMLGMAALFVEGTLVGLSTYALAALPRRHPVTNGVAAMSGVPQEASGLVAVGHSNGSSG
jgi:hypothetical protein